MASSSKATSEQCFICGKQQPRYAHFERLNTEQQKFLLRHCGEEISREGCMCRAHALEASRHHSDPGYFPTWKEKGVSGTTAAECMQLGCDSTSSNERIISCTPEMVTTFSQLLGYDASTLCETHYQELYRQLHSPTPCAGCGKKPKAREGAYTRHSPDATMVSEHLQRTGFDGNICETDTLCKSCYNMHLVILQSTQQDHVIPNLRADTIAWGEAIREDSSELTRAVLGTVLYVAKALLQDRALLLPHVVSMFMDLYPHTETDELHLQLGDGRVKFSPKWLMHQLITHLQPYMTYRCVVKKLGTLLYPKDSDLLKCLSLALHDAQLGRDSVRYERPVHSNEEQTLREASITVNDLLHDEIRRLKSQDADLATFDLRNSIEKTNPMLWEFVCSCTKSVRQRTGHKNSDDEHVKTVRRFFIVCAMLFTTNPSCSTTLHHLVAETAEVMGGSRQLIRVLNRLGVCVANDTHDELVTTVAESRRSQLWTDLSPGIFKVCSADNIDFFTGHALVYCGNQARSCHLTSIQLAEPIPSLTVQCSMETANANQTPPVGLDEPSHHDGSHSPHNKSLPKRRRTMQLSPARPATDQHFQTMGQLTPPATVPLELQKFLEGEVDKASKLKLIKQSFAYFLQKVAKPDLEEGKVLKPLREFILPTPAQLAYPNPSTIAYMDLLDENADSHDTMAVVAEMLQEQLMESQQSIVLVGDGKTFDHLQSVKRMYGSACENLFIFPGGWHILKNYQPVLIKAYYHAGLKDIAQGSGYRAATLTSLEACSHFQRTHSFLIQVWEALFIEMVRSFTGAIPQQADLVASVKGAMEGAIHNEQTDTHELLLTVQLMVSDACALDAFMEYTKMRAATDETWNLWSNFVLNDCFAYVGLFLAIRTSDWDLRLFSLKSMASLFSAYDRPCYQKLIPNHLADLQSYPSEVIDCFRAGGFTVKVKGGIGHAVALDEAHEMCINRDLKMAVTRPTLPYLKKMTHFFSYRIKAQKQLQAQLFPVTGEDHARNSHTILDSTKISNCWDENIEKMCSLISEHKVFPVTEANRELVNVFTGTKARAEQSHDLLHARSIGEQVYNNYVTHHILQIPSVSEAPMRRKRLLTMAPLKETKTRLSQKEKEERDINKLLRRRLAWCNQTGLQYDASEEQYSLLPRALAEADGTLHQGSKCKWTDKLQKRYDVPSSTPFASALPWVPEVAIVDAMFAINVNPLRQHKTIEEYAYFLFRQFALPHFRSGTCEVHLVFDNPGRLSFNPKDCVHQRRYGETSREHTHISGTSESLIPRPWREYLDCRQCKRFLVEAIGTEYLITARHHLEDSQTLVLAGCFSGENQDDAWSITGCCLPQTTEQYRSNAQEADMRVWRHATQTNHSHVLIYSPDTDVFNIGLAVAQPTQQYMVQINLPHKPSRYVNINKLLTAFRCDPDLASLPQNDLGGIMLQLYIVTGCDYTSFFAGIGKTTFMNYFFLHAEFIAGTNFSGCLFQTQASDMEAGFMSFVRLVGTAYFKKNLATVVSKLDVETPNQLYNSIDPQLSDKDKHKQWYQSIKRVVRVMSEEQRPPTLTALWRHWMRSCWVKEMWRNSTQLDQYDGLLTPETQGWLKSDNGYSIDWEEEEVRQQIRKTIDFLSKGCTCKTGCKTKRCSCQKNGRQCGASCECRGCTNLQLHTPPTIQEEEEQEEEREEEREEEQEDSESDEIIETEVVTTFYDMDFF